MWPLIAALALAGCTASKPGGRSTTYPGGAVTAHGQVVAKPPTIIVTPTHANVGKVTSVNAKERFVVVTYALGNLPGGDRRLNVYRGGLKVGEIKTNPGLARDNNIVADIVAGECQVGDEVKED
jgi:hypothetical protein